MYYNLVNSLTRLHVKWLQINPVHFQISSSNSATYDYKLLPGTVGVDNGYFNLVNSGKVGDRKAALFQERKVDYEIHPNFTIYAGGFDANENKVILCDNLAVCKKQTEATKYLLWFTTQQGQTQNIVNYAAQLLLLLKLNSDVCSLHFIGIQIKKTFLTFALGKNSI